MAAALASVRWMIAGPYILGFETRPYLIQVCAEVHDRLALEQQLARALGQIDGYSLTKPKLFSLPASVISCRPKPEVKIEIVAQPLELSQQGFVLIQGLAEKLLARHGQELGAKIAARLAHGDSLAAALGSLLGVEGDPHQALCQLARLEDWEYQIRYR